MISCTGAMVRSAYYEAGSIAFRGRRCLHHVASATWQTIRWLPGP